MYKTISRAVMICGLFLVAAEGATLAVSTYALDRLGVGGPHYSKIIAGKDVVADLLPPPLYIVEAYLETRLALDDPARSAEYQARLAKLHKDFNERRDHWAKSDLLPAGLATQLTSAVAVDADKFWSEL